MSSRTLGGIVAGIVAVALACVIGAAVFIGGVAGACGIPTDPDTSPVVTPPDSSTVDPLGICGDGAIVLARASTWLTAWQGGPVPYLSSPDPATWLQSYRRDCSGYASMALGLNGPGLTTAELADESTPIAKIDLQPGDLLINPAPDLQGHVVIFDRWVDRTMTSYVGYEQSGDGGTHHRVIPYPYFSDYPMSPYRHEILGTIEEMTATADTTARQTPLGEVAPPATPPRP